tara:strand:+ start:67 stop:303 length:237 start_codon:yes stop_codon:yes gene_type:complete
MVINIGTEVVVGQRAPAMSFKGIVADVAERAHDKEVFYKVVPNSISGKVEWHPQFLVKLAPSYHSAGRVTNEKSEGDV